MGPVKENRLWVTTFSFSSLSAELDVFQIFYVEFYREEQTAEQESPWDLSKGHWQSGVTPIDEAKPYKIDNLPDAMKSDESNNSYYFLPLIFGLLGLVYHYIQKKEEFIVLLILFVITGIGIIIYSDQPPNEPRERDYIFVGSFMTCVYG